MAPASALVRAKRDGRSLERGYRACAVRRALRAHKQALFTFLGERWKDLFRADFEVLLYHLTSTYFECDPPEAAERNSATAATSARTA